MYETKIVYGDDLRKMVKTVKGLKNAIVSAELKNFCTVQTERVYALFTV